MHTICGWLQGRQLEVEQAGYFGSDIDSKGEKNSGTYVKEVKQTLFSVASNAIQTLNNIPKTEVNEANYRTNNSPSQVKWIRVANSRQYFWRLNYIRRD